MMDNANLYKARDAKKDEFYTQLVDIEWELAHYKKHFKDKTILCNCDNPEYSNFWKYFHLNFSGLGLRKLISTHYDPNSPVYKMEYAGGNDSDIKSGSIAYLESNGDFRSKECIDILDSADIVVTNPPFSLFREYIAQLTEYKKRFLIWGNNNAITYKDIFPLLKDNKIWLGYMVNKTCVFQVGDGYEYDENLTNRINDGHKYGKVPAVSVFTNLDINKRHDYIEMNCSYNPDLYPKYVNYDAIEVSSVHAIPKDYDDIMGVPITFLSVYNPDQFEIIGNSRDLCIKMSEIAAKGEYMQGGVRPYIKIDNGKYKYKRLYDRLFIRKK